MTAKEFRKDLLKEIGKLQKIAEKAYDKETESEIQAVIEGRMRAYESVTDLIKSYVL